MKATVVLTCLVLFLGSSPGQDIGSGTPDGAISIDTVEIHPSFPLLIVKFTNTKDYDSDQDYFESAQVQLFSPHDTIPFQVIADSTFGVYDVGFADVNFDGYKDLRIDAPMSLSGVNTPCDFWIYNSSTHRFDESPEFSGFSNVEIDETDSTIYSENNWAGRHGSHSYRYKVIEGHPVLMEEEYDDWGNRSVKKLIDHRLQEVVKETWQENQEADGQWYVSFTREEFVFGKLRPTSRVRKRRVEGRPTGIERELYEADFAGRFVLISREAISYGLNQWQQVVRRTMRREAKNGAWVLTNESEEVVK